MQQAHIPSEFSYTAVHEGQIRFGVAERITDDVDVIIDTRNHEDEVFTDIDVSQYGGKPKQLIVQSIHPQNQIHIDFDEFQDWLDEITEDGKSEKVFYCVDMNGAGRSAMIAGCLLQRLSGEQGDAAIDELTEAYLAANRVPDKFVSMGAPRYSTQRYFLRWATERTELNTQYTKWRYKNKAAANRNRKARLRGTIRCNRIIHMFKDFPSLHPRLEGHKNIHLFYSRSGKWCKMHPRRVGPIKFVTKGMYDVVRQEFAYDMHSFRIAHQVFPEEIGEDGKPNALFYKTFQEITRVMRQEDYNPFAREMGNNIKSEPEFYWYNGMKLTYLQFRVGVFTPFYATLIKQHELYAELDEALEDGNNLMLITRTAEDWVEQGHTLKEHLVDPDSNWDFAHIICALLRGETPWLDKDLTLPPHDFKKVSKSDTMRAKSAAER